MPVYDYYCRDCKKSFEIVKSIRDYKPRSVRCPKCESRDVERKWSTIFVETSKKS